MSMMSKVVVEDVVKRFRTHGGDVMALNGVSLTAEPGRMTSVVGASGSGKTTLLYIVGTLETPDSGLITVGGEDLFSSGLDLVKYRREKVGFVFQFFNLVNYFTAVENVMLPMSISGRFGNGERKRAEGLLTRMGIGDTRWNHRPTRLSGGEQQRVAIARAMANDPEIILADEPTGNLDSATGDTIVALLRELAEEGRCVIIVTHDETVAERSDAVAYLKDGKRLE